MWFVWYVRVFAIVFLIGYLMGINLASPSELFDPQTAKIVYAVSVALGASAFVLFVVEGAWRFSGWLWDKGFPAIWARWKAWRTPAAAS